MDGLIKNALFVADADDWLTAADVLHALKEIGNLRILQIKEIEERLKALYDEHKLQRKYIGRNLAYRLTDVEEQALRKTFDDSASLIDRIVLKLFKFSVHDGNPISLRSYFLAVSCEVFSALGSQAAGYITGKPIQDFLNASRLDQIIENALIAFKIPAGSKKDVKRKTLQFFQENDPEANQVKFALGQSLYVAHLLGMDGQDFLCDHTFRDGTLFLDSNVTIPAVLSESRHHKIFQELMQVCRRLNMKVYVCRPTIDEVKRKHGAFSKR